MSAAPKNPEPKQPLGGLLVAAGKQIVLTTLVSGVVLAAIAIVWRFLDLYEASVKASSVLARIEMERHQYWLEEVKARRQTQSALSPQQTTELLQKQIKEVPATIPETKAQ